MNRARTIANQQANGPAGGPDGTEADGVSRPILKLVGGEQREPLPAPFRITLDPWPEARAIHVTLLPEARWESLDDEDRRDFRWHEASRHYVKMSITAITD